MLRTANRRRLIARNVSISQLLLGGSKAKAPVTSPSLLVLSARHIHSSGKFSNSNNPNPSPNPHDPNSNPNSRPANSNPPQNQWKSGRPPPLPGRGTGVYNVPSQKQFSSPQPGPLLNGRTSAGGSSNRETDRPGFGERAHTLKPYSPTGQGQQAHSVRNAKLEALLEEVAGTSPQPPKKNVNGYGMQNRPSVLQSQYGAPPLIKQQPPGYGSQHVAPPLIQQQPPGFGSNPHQFRPQPLGQQPGTPPPIQSQYGRLQQPPPPSLPGQYASPPVLGQYGQQSGGQSYGTQQGQVGRFGVPIPQGQAGKPGLQPPYGQTGVPPPFTSQHGAQQQNAITNPFANRPEQRQSQPWASPPAHSQYGTPQPAPQPNPAGQSLPQSQSNAPPLIPPLPAKPKYPFTAQPPQGQSSVPRQVPPQSRFGSQAAALPHSVAGQQSTYGQFQVGPQNTQKASPPSSSPLQVDPNRQRPPQGYPSAEQYGIRPSSPPHPFAVQQPQQGQPGMPPSPNRFAAQQPSQGSQRQHEVSPSVAEQYGARPASSTHQFAVQQPPKGFQGQSPSPAEQYGSRPAPSTHRFAVQQPPQSSQGQQEKPPPFGAQYGARPAIAPQKPPQGQPEVPRSLTEQFGARLASTSHPFAVQQPLQGQLETPPSLIEQYGARPASTPHPFSAQQPLQGQPEVPPSLAEQYGARSASTPHRFAVQKPPQGQPEVPPSLAEQYGARPASTPHRFAFQQPSQPNPTVSQSPNARFPWLRPQQAEREEQPPVPQQSNARFPWLRSQPAGPEEPQFSRNGQRQFGHQQQPRDDYNNYQRRDTGNYNNAPFAQENDRGDKITPTVNEQEIIDTRKKKAAVSKDKDKRAAAFQVAESFLVDDDPAEKAAREARLAKRRAKREKPVPIFLPQFISVSLLANMLKVPLDKFLQKLTELGFVELGHNHVLSAEDAGLIAMEYNFDPIVDTSERDDLKPRPWPPSVEEKEHLPPRPPVVTIMGHVDHGKTTLLDYLRKSSVAANEHGGITQHIGAFSVQMSTGKTVTFLDTPGHAAFLSMRERGANVTDIVILVVAADDSVMPQTIEAIKHAKGAGVPMIVAVNKCDKESADVEKVKYDLANNGVEIEDFGGDTQVIKVSGKTGLGIPDLEEAILALADMIDMRAEPDGPAEGWILEAATKKRGRVATVLVRRGTMRPGDIIVAGKTWARVRNLLNEAGVEIESAGPGTPVEVDGWRDQPEAGDLVIQAPHEDKAKSVIDYRIAKADRLKQAADMEAINESRRILREKDEAEKLAVSDPEAAAGGTTDAEAAVEKSKGEEEGTKCQEINFIVKADVSGSVEAVNNAILAIGNSEIKAKIIRSSFGSVSEFDVDHASAAGATILSFNLPLDPLVASYAHRKSVPILQSSIIYRLVEDVTSLLSSKLPPKIHHKVLGEAEILQVFPYKVKGSGSSKTVLFAGCRVKTGTIYKGGKVKIVRGMGKDGGKGETVWIGTMSSLKNVKVDADEMKQGTECGVGLDGWEGFEVGDTVQSFTEVVEKRSLH